MDEDWWAVDGEILTHLAANPALTPQELGDKLGLSEAAIASLLALLAAEGKVAIRFAQASRR